MSTLSAGEKEDKPLGYLLNLSKTNSFTVTAVLKYRLHEEIIIKVAGIFYNLKTILSCFSQINGTFAISARLIKTQFYIFNSAMI